MDYRCATVFAKYPLFVTSTSAARCYTLDHGYFLMINYKYFQSKYFESRQVRINKIEFVNLTRWPTARKMKFSNENFFSKCDQIRSFLKKFLMENFIFVQWPWKNGVAVNKNYCNLFSGINRHLYKSMGAISFLKKHSTLQIFANQPQTTYYNRCLK